jgi:16S rRNA (cytosine967-C5)-methyltransferase
MIDKAREIALKTLYETDKNEAYSNIALDEMLKQARKLNQKIDQRDIGFISEIVYGTISWKLTIDEIIKKYSNIKIKKISPWILNILRMSIYQIVFLDRVPKSAAVNEGVNLAKRYGHKASSNFVNAILRKVDRKDYEEFFNIKDDIERISKTTSIPTWIVEELLKENSIQKVEEICKASNLKPKLFIRINTLKTDKQTLIKELEKQDIKVQESKEENFLIIEGAKNLEDLNSFREGMFTVQDEAAGLIAKILNPKENEKVLDACSSPGGKTTYMAELMNNQGKITAWDLHEHRVKLVNEAKTRLGIDIIKTEVKDATIYEEKYFETFDKILLDVPCLGLGVLKRKPDIKWKRKKEDINEITKIQEKILYNCSKYLKQGGELVYSTCSILEEENNKIINKFIKDNQNYEIDKRIQIYQNEETDGFFICKMRKNKEKT